MKWFGLLPFRSPLLRESRLISSRRATEMFQFTRCPPSLPMCSAGGLQTSLWRSCPIGNLRAHRLHAAPPERFAGLRVLLRPSAPRHPPCPLCSLFSFPPSGTACGTGVGRVWLASWCLRCSSASVLQACSRQNRSNYDSSVGKVLFCLFITNLRCRCNMPHFQEFVNTFGSILATSRKLA